MRWRRRAIPYVAQAEMADCGAAALVMALAYYGKHSGVAIMLEPAETFEAGGRSAPGALHHARRLLTRSSGLGKVLATSVVVRLMALAVPALTGVVVDRIVPADDGHLLNVMAAVMVAIIGYSTRGPAPGRDRQSTISTGTSIIHASSGTSVINPSGGSVLNPSGGTRAQSVRGTCFQPVGRLTAEHIDRLIRTFGARRARYQYTPSRRSAVSGRADWRQARAQRA